MARIDAGPRLGSLSMRQLGKALDRFGLGKPVSAEPLSNGHFGQNLLVTADGGRYVLRGRPRYPWQFPVEAFYADLLHTRAGLPTPSPYRVDNGTDIFGWGYALMPWLPGRPLPDGDVRAGMDPVDQRGVARALAATLALVHTVTGDTTGRWMPFQGGLVRPFERLAELDWPAKQPGRGGPPIGWRDRTVRRALHRLGEAARINDTTTRDDLAWAERIFDTTGPALDVPFQPVVVLEDFKPGNVHVDGQGGHWRVSGLFDLMEACFGDGDADLPRMVCSYLDTDPELAGLFLSEYLARRPPRPGFADRFTAHLLADRALLWFFLQHEGLRFWPAEWTFQHWAGRYLELAGPVLRAVSG